MVSLRLQARLASKILGCGRRRVWLDPNETADIGLANSRANVRRLIRDGFIIRKPIRIHSRFRTRRRIEEKKKGRHTGIGKRRGTREARYPTKRLWIKRSRILRRLLKKFRDAKKIDSNTYHGLYKKCKGGAYKNKRTLTEAIFRQVAVKAKEKALADEIAAKKAKEVEKAEAVRKAKEKVKERKAASRAKAREEAAAKEAATKSAKGGKKDSGKTGAKDQPKAAPKAAAKAAKKK
eukprot:TRINITY_DN32328_c0_g1_i1.p1 TRINITY_DN32328_c0_g1~~TRINITY_DN32328_c0_g1_i1.p1  ORF type:complete len:236 (+),score=53.80 TRINITY_DN32328_c0_g1_i1:47-754(+)